LNKELKYYIALSLIPGIGSVNAQNLIAYLGSPEAVFKEKKQALEKITGIGAFLAKNIIKSDVLSRADASLDFIEKYKIKTYVFNDKKYPIRLKQCSDAPIVLFQKGEINLNANKIISIVGTRTPSNYGKTQCNNLIEELKLKGFSPIVVSGLAYGIDACAHRAALENNLETLAVLAHGLDRIYPATHKKMAIDIVEKGALLTEFVNEVYPARTNFISRNRIIAGLSDLTIVMESPKKGGSLITADMAFGYNREVMALPARINDKKSAGCNYLIKSNKAAMLESVDDIVKLLSWEEKNKQQSKSEQLELFQQLNDEQKRLMIIMEETENCSIDYLSRALKKPTHLLLPVLLELEFMSLIQTLPGNIFKLNK
jgi:DNA processing protein